MLILRTLISCNLASKSLTLDQFNGLLFASLRVRVSRACFVQFHPQSRLIDVSGFLRATPYVAEGRGEHVRHSLRQS